MLLGYQLLSEDRNRCGQAARNCKVHFKKREITVFPIWKHRYLEFGGLSNCLILLLLQDGTAVIDISNWSKTFWILEIP